MVMRRVAGNPKKGARKEREDEEREEEGKR